MSNNNEITISARIKPILESKDVNEIGKTLSELSSKIDPLQNLTQQQKDELKSKIDQAKGYFEEGEADAQGNPTYHLVGDLAQLGSGVLPAFIKHVRELGTAVTNVVDASKTYKDNEKETVKFANNYRKALSTADALKSISKTKFGQETSSDLYGDVARLVSNRFNALAAEEKTSLFRETWATNLSGDESLRKAVNALAKRKSTEITEEDVTQLIKSSVYGMGPKAMIRDEGSRFAPLYHSTETTGNPNDIFGNRAIKKLYERGATLDPTATRSDEKQLNYSSGLYKDIRLLQHRGNKVANEIALETGLAQYEEGENGLQLRWADQPTQDQMRLALAKSLSIARRARGGQAIFERDADLNPNMNSTFSEALEFIKLFSARANGKHGDEFTKRYITPAGLELEQDIPTQFIPGRKTTKAQHTIGKIPTYAVPYTTLQEDSEGNLSFVPRSRDDMHKVVTRTGQLKVSKKDMGMMLQNSQLTHMMGLNPKDSGSFGLGYDENGSAIFYDEQHKPLIVAMPLDDIYEKEGGFLKKDRTLTPEGVRFEKSVDTRPTYEGVPMQYVYSNGDSAFYANAEQYDNRVKNAAARGLGNPFWGYDPTQREFLVPGDYGASNKHLAGAKRIGTQGRLLSDIFSNGIDYSKLKFGTFSVAAQEELNKYYGTKTYGDKLVDGAGFIDPAFSSFSFMARSMGEGFKGVLGNYDWRDYLRQTVKYTDEAKDSPFIEFDQNVDPDKRNVTKFLMPSVAFKQLTDDQRKAVMANIALNNPAFLQRITGGDAKRIEEIRKDAKLDEKIGQMTYGTLLDDFFQDLTDPSLGGLAEAEMLKTRSQMTMIPKDEFVKFASHQDNHLYPNDPAGAAKVLQEKKARGLIREIDGRQFVQLNAQETNAHINAAMSDSGLFASKADDEFNTENRWIGKQLAEASGFTKQDREKSAQLVAERLAEMEDVDYWISKDKFSARPDIRRRFEEADDKAAFVKTDSQAIEYIKSQITGLRKKSFQRYMLPSEAGYSLAFPILGSFFENAVSNSGASIKNGPLAWTYLQNLQDPEFLKKELKFTDEELKSITVKDDKTKEEKIDIEKLLFAPGQGKEVLSGRSPSAIDTFSKMANLEAKGVSLSSLIGGDNSIAMLLPEAINRMNTGDFDGDTIWMYSQFSKDWAKNLDRFNEYAQVRPEDAAEIQALLDEQKEQLKGKEIAGTLGKRESERLFLYKQSQGEMGKASAIMRNALDLYDLTKEEDRLKFAKAYKLASRYYDFATSEGQKEGWVGDYMEAAVKGSYMASRQFSRFQKLVSEDYGVPQEDRQKDQPSIFSHRLRSLNNLQDIGAAIAQAKIRRDTGDDFGFGDMVNAWVDNEYGVGSKGYNNTLFNVAREWAEVLIGQNDLSKIFSKQELETKFTNWDKLLETEEAKATDEDVKERLKSERTTLGRAREKIFSKSAEGYYGDAALVTENLGQFISQFKGNEKYKDILAMYQEAQQLAEYYQSSDVDHVIADADYQASIDENLKKIQAQKEAVNATYKGTANGFINYWVDYFKNRNPSTTQIEQFIKNPTTLKAQLRQYNDKGELVQSPDLLPVEPNFWSRQFQQEGLVNDMRRGMGLLDKLDLNTPFGSFIHEALQTTVLNAEKARLESGAQHATYTPGDFMSVVRDLWANGSTAPDNKNTVSWKDYLTGSLGNLKNPLTDEEWKSIESYITGGTPDAELKLSPEHELIASKIKGAFVAQNNKNDYFFRDLFAKGHLFEAETQIVDPETREVKGAYGPNSRVMVQDLLSKNKEDMTHYGPDMIWQMGDDDLNSDLWMFDWKPATAGAKKSLYQMINYTRQAEASSQAAYDKLSEDLRRKRRTGLLTQEELDTAGLSKEEQRWLKYRDSEGRFRLKTLYGRDYTNSGDYVYDYAGNNERGGLNDLVMNKDLKNARELWLASRSGKNGTGLLGAFKQMMDMGVINPNDTVPVAMEKYIGHEKTFQDIADAASKFKNEHTVDGQNFSGSEYIKSNPTEWNYLVAEQAQNKEKLTELTDRIRTVRGKYRNKAVTDAEYSQFSDLYTDLAALDNPELIGALTAVYGDTLPAAMQDIGQYAGDRDAQEKLLNTIVRQASIQDPTDTMNAFKRQLYGSQGTNVYDKVQGVISRANLAAGSRQSLKDPFRERFFNTQGFVADNLWEEAAEIQKNYTDHYGATDEEAEKANRARSEFIDKLKKNYGFDSADETGRKMDSESFLENALIYANAQEGIDQLRFTERELISRLYEDDRKEIATDVDRLIGVTKTPEARAQATIDKKRQEIDNYIASGKMDIKETDSQIDKYIEKLSSDYNGSLRTTLKDAASSGDMDKLNAFIQSASGDDLGIIEQIKNIVMRKTALQEAVNKLDEYLNNGFEAFSDGIKEQSALDARRDNLSSFANVYSYNAFADAAVRTTHEAMQKQQQQVQTDRYNEQVAARDAYIQKQKEADESFRPAVDNYNAVLSRVGIADTPEKQVQIDEARKAYEEASARKNQQLAESRNRLSAAFGPGAAMLVSEADKMAMQAEETARAYAEANLPEINLAERQKLIQERYAELTQGIPEQTKTVEQLQAEADAITIPSARAGKAKRDTQKVEAARQRAEQYEARLEQERQSEFESAKYLAGRTATSSAKEDFSQTAELRKQISNINYEDFQNYQNGGRVDKNIRQAYEAIGQSLDEERYLKASGRSAYDHPDSLKGLSMQSMNAIEAVIKRSKGFSNKEIRNASNMLKYMSRFDGTDAAPISAASALDLKNNAVIMNAVKNSTNAEAIALLGGDLGARRNAIVDAATQLQQRGLLSKEIAERVGLLTPAELERSDQSHLHGFMDKNGNFIDYGTRRDEAIRNANREYDYRKESIEAKREQDKQTAIDEENARWASKEEEFRLETQTSRRHSNAGKTKDRQKAKEQTKESNKRYNEAKEDHKQKLKEINEQFANAQEYADAITEAGKTRDQAITKAHEDYKASQQIMKSTGLIKPEQQEKTEKKKEPEAAKPERKKYKLSTRREAASLNEGTRNEVARIEEAKSQKASAEGAVEQEKENVKRREAAMTRARAEVDEDLNRQYEQNVDEVTQQAKHKAKIRASTRYTNADAAGRNMIDQAERDANQPPQETQPSVQQSTDYEEVRKAQARARAAQQISQEKELYDKIKNIDDKELTEGQRKEREKLKTRIGTQESAQKAENLYTQFYLEQDREKERLGEMAQDTQLRQMERQGNLMRYNAFGTRRDFIQRAHTLKNSTLTQYENRQISIERQLSAEKDKQKRYAEDSDEYKKSASRIAELQKNSQDAQHAIDSLNTPLGTAQAYMASFGQSLSGIANRLGRQAFQKMIQEAKRFVQEYNKTMTNIQMITLKSDSEMATLGDGLMAKAKELKISFSEIAQMSTDLYRQGLSDEEMNERLDVIAKFSKVSGTKATDATKLITTAMNTGLVDDASYAADVVAMIGDSAATNAAQIEKGIEKSGAAAATDGTTYAQLVAMLTAITATTQVTGNVAGTTLNSIFGRMNKVGTNELVYDENGNAMSGSAIAKLLRAQGIETNNADGSRRSTFNMLYDLAQKYDTMSDDEQRQIATAISGTRQFSNFGAIMTGIKEGDIDRYLELAGEAGGSVDKKYEIYSDSLQASLDTLRNTFDELVKNLTDSGALQGFVQTLTNMVQGVTNLSNAFGGLGGVITAILPLMASFLAFKIGLSTPGLIGAGIAAAGLAGMAVTAAALDAAGSNTEVSPTKVYEEAKERRDERYENARTSIDRAKELDKKGENRTSEEQKEYENLIGKLGVQFESNVDALGNLKSSAENAASSLDALGKQVIEDADRRSKENRVKGIYDDIGKASGSIAKEVNDSITEFNSNSNLYSDFLYGKLWDNDENGNIRVKDNIASFWAQGSNTGTAKDILANILADMGEQYGYFDEDLGFDMTSAKEWRNQIDFWGGNLAPVITEPLNKYLNVQQMQDQETRSEHTNNDFAQRLSKYLLKEEIVDDENEAQDIAKGLVFDYNEKYGQQKEINGVNLSNILSEFLGFDVSNPNYSPENMRQHILEFKTRKQILSQSDKIENAKLEDAGADGYYYDEQGNPVSVKEALQRVEDYNNRVKQETTVSKVVTRDKEGSDLNNIPLETYDRETSSTSDKAKAEAQEYIERQGKYYYWTDAKGNRHDKDKQGNWYTQDTRDRDVGEYAKTENIWHEGHRDYRTGEYIEGEENLTYEEAQKGSNTTSLYLARADGTRINDEVFSDVNSAEAAAEAHNQAEIERYARESKERQDFIDRNTAATYQSLVTGETLLFRGKNAKQQADEYREREIEENPWIIRDLETGEYLASAETSEKAYEIADRDYARIYDQHGREYGRGVEGRKALEEANAALRDDTENWDYYINDVNVGRGAVGKAIADASKMWKFNGEMYTSKAVAEQAELDAYKSTLGDWADRLYYTSVDDQGNFVYESRNDAMRSLIAQAKEGKIGVGYLGGIEEIEGVADRKYVGDTLKETPRDFAGYTINNLKTIAAAVTESIPELKEVDPADIVSVWGQLSDHAQKALETAAETGELALEVIDETNEALKQAEPPKLKAIKNHFANGLAVGQAAWDQKNQLSTAANAMLNMMTTQQFGSLQELFNYVNENDIATWETLNKNEDFANIMRGVSWDEHGKVTGSDDVLGQAMSFLFKAASNTQNRVFTNQETANLAMKAFTGLTQPDKYRASYDLIESEFNQANQDFDTKYKEQHGEDLSFEDWAKQAGIDRMPNWQTNSDIRRGYESYLHGRQSLYKHEQGVLANINSWMESVGIEGYLTEDQREALKGVVGDSIYNKLATGQKLTEEETTSATQAIQNRGVGLTSLTSRQKLAGAKDVRDKISKGMQFGFEEGQYNTDVASKYLEGWDNAASYMALVQAKATDKNLFESLGGQETLDNYNKSLDEFIKNSQLKIDVEGIETLEEAGDLLEGTSNLVSQLQKNGTIPIKASVEFSSQLYENQQVGAKLTNGSFAEQMEAIKSLTGLTDTQISKDFQGAYSLAQQMLGEQRSQTSTSLTKLAKVNPKEATRLASLYGYSPNADYTEYVDRLTKAGYSIDENNNVINSADVTDETRTNRLKNRLSYVYTGENETIDQENTFIGAKRKYSETEIAAARRDLLEENEISDNDLFQQAVEGAGPELVEYRRMLEENAAALKGGKEAVYNELAVSEQKSRAQREIQLEEEDAVQKDITDRLSKSSDRNIRKNASEIASNIDVLRNGTAYERSAVYSGYYSDISKLSMAQSALNGDLTNESNQEYIATLLGVDPEYVKATLSKEGGKGKLESQVQQKVSDITEKIRTELLGSLGIEFEATDIESLQTEIDSKITELQGSTEEIDQAVIDKLQEASDALKAGTATLSPDQAIDTYGTWKKETNNTAAINGMVNNLTTGMTYDQAIEALVGKGKTFNEDADFVSFLSENTAITNVLQRLKEGGTMTPELMNMFTQASTAALLSPDENNRQQASKFYGLTNEQGGIDVTALQNLVNEDDVFRAWIEQFEELNDLSLDVNGTLDGTGASIKSLKSSINSLIIKALRPWGDQTEEILERQKSVNRTLKDQNTANKNWRTALKNFNNDQYSREALRKGKGIDNETKNYLESLGFDKKDYKNKDMWDEISAAIDEDEAAGLEELTEAYQSAFGDISDQLSDYAHNNPIMVDGVNVSVSEGTISLEGQALLDQFSAFLSEQQKQMIQDAINSGLQVIYDMYSDGKGNISVVPRVTGISGGSSVGGTGRRDSSKKGGGGGKSKLDALIEGQGHYVKRYEHDINMAETYSTYLQRANDYQGSLDAIDAQIIAQQRLKNQLEANVVELEKMQATLKRGSEDWYKAQEQIDSYRESIAGTNNAIKDLNGSKIQITETKQANEDKPTTHASSMLSLKAQNYMDRGQFENYAVVKQNEIKNMRVDMAINEQQKSEWEDQLKIYEEGSQDWIDVRDRIWSIIEENAQLENQILEETNALNEARISQVATDLQNSLAPYEHEQNMLGTYGSIYQNDQRFVDYRESLSQTNGYNETQAAYYQNAIAELQKQMKGLDVGSEAWLNGRDAIYQYQEALASTTLTIQENTAAIEESYVTELTDKYQTSKGDLDHEARMAQLTADYYERDKDYVNYQNMLGVQAEITGRSIANTEKNLAAFEAKLNDGTIRAGSEAWKNLKSQILSAREELLEGKNTMADLERQMQQSEIEHYAEKFNKAYEQVQHNIKMIEKEIQKYQANGEFTNQNIMIGYNNKELEESRKLIEDYIEVINKSLEDPNLNDDSRKGLINDLYKWEEALKDVNNSIEKNKDLIKKNNEAIVKTKNVVEEAVLAEIKDRIKAERDMLDGRTAMENNMIQVIRKRYQDEWALVQKDINKKKEALNKEKSLISERLNAKKEAVDAEDRYEQLAELQRQYALISSDVTRSKDALALKKQIDDLSKENAMYQADKAAQAQTEALDEQIKAYDDDLSTRSEQLNEYLENANNFKDELNLILTGSYEDYVEWMKVNNEDYKNSTDATRQVMENSWEDTWKKMKDIVDTYWTEIATIISSQESFISFMNEGRKRRHAETSTGAELQDISNERIYEEWQNAIRATATWDHDHEFIEQVEKLKEYTYTVEPTPDFISEIGKYFSDPEYVFERDKTVSADARTYTGYDQYSEIIGAVEGLDSMVADIRHNVELIATQSPTVEVYVGDSSSSSSSGSGGGGSGGKKTVNTAQKYYLGWVQGTYTTGAVSNHKDKSTISAQDAYEKAKSHFTNTGMITSYSDKTRSTTSKDEYDKWKVFKEGGMVNYTGPAWVDGTKTKPEAFLDAVDTENIKRLTNALNYISVAPMITPGFDLMQGNTQNIGDINITINEAKIDNDYDVARLADQVSSQFAKALSKRGLNLSQYAF